MGISEAQAHCATAMQAIAKKREDCELQYLLSRSVRNSRAAALCLHRSFALRSSASLHPAQRALGSVMSQVKRCAQSGSSPRVLIIPKCRQNKRPCIAWSFVLLDSGGYLLSRTVASQVPSAYEGLTSVFGMGTGGTLQLNHRKGVVFVNTLKTA